MNLAVERFLHVQGGKCWMAAVFQIHCAVHNSLHLLHLPCTAVQLAARGEFHYWVAYRYLQAPGIERDRVLDVYIKEVKAVMK